MKQPQTFIFIGRSGCGKGTQAELLKEHLIKQDKIAIEAMEKETGEVVAPENQTSVYYLETGLHFRSFMSEKGSSNKLASEVSALGNRQPDFLAIWMWSNLLIREFNPKDQLIIDGSPRSHEEAVILDTAMRFYKREMPFVVYLDVSREWSRKHLLSRGREDDIDIAMIEKRLDWYQRDVIPAINYFKENENYHFLHINGEQPVEKVQRDLINEINSRI
ncbi:MAG: nucleoside monophosphate kinase [Candidatus Pacebacteria bacterium]|nr:nucleoside monophosphate kinase [Candidatus Paceibacterota bacterium]